MNDRVLVTSIQENADELPLCDADIQDVFRGKSYLLGVPIMAQLVKEIRLLREALKSHQAGAV